MGGGRPSNTLLCLTLRDNTERPETITIGTNELIGTNPSKLPPALARVDGRAVEKARFLRNGTARQQSGLSSIWRGCWQVNETTPP